MNQRRRYQLAQETPMTKLLITVALVAAIQLGSASAAPVVFTNEAQFLAAAGPLSFEGFEQSPPGETGSSRGTPNFIIGPVDAGTLLILDDPAFASDGTRSAAGDAPGMFFVFDLDNPITAFGFTIIDFGNTGVADTLQLTLSHLGTVIAMLTVASSDPFEPLRFFGVISTEPFSSAVLRKTEGGDDFFAIDSVHSGIAPRVSEPSTGLLASFGLLTLALWAAGRAVREQRLK